VLTILALQSAYSGVLNVATGRPETLNKLRSYIEMSGGQKAKLDFAPPRLGDIRASYAKTEKAKQAWIFVMRWL